MQVLERFSAQRPRPAGLHFSVHSQGCSARHGHTTAPGRPASATRSHLTSQPRVAPRPVWGNQAGRAVCNLCALVNYIKCPSGPAGSELCPVWMAHRPAPGLTPQVESQDTGPEKKVDVVPSRIQSVPVRQALLVARGCRVPSFLPSRAHTLARGRDPGGGGRHPRSSVSCFPNEGEGRGAL